MSKLPLETFRNFVKLWPTVPLYMEFTQMNKILKDALQIIILNNFKALCYDMLKDALKKKTRFG
jgi:hypothetical protein